MEVFYIGYDAVLTYGAIYQQHSLLFTPYGVMARLRENGRDVAIVPRADVMPVKDGEVCPYCDGDGTYVYGVPVPEINPRDPYGEPIVGYEPALGECDHCLGRGFVVHPRDSIFIAVDEKHDLPF